MKREIENEILLPKVGEWVAGGHTVTLLVKGQSMNPFLRHGRDRVTLAPFTDAQLQPGVVVLAREQGSGRIVLHRIIRRQGHQLTLQGDGNVGLREESRTDLVLARVVILIRGAKSYPVEGTIWRLYSRLWLWLTPIRRWLLAIYRRLPRMLNKYLL